MIFKEAVNNSVRHARCSRIEIDLGVDASTLRLVLRDNGVGFDTAADRDGQGLTSMQRRANRLRGRLEIVSGAGDGTTLRLELPICTLRDYVGLHVRVCAYRDNSDRSHGHDRPRPPNSHPGPRRHHRGPS